MSIAEIFAYRLFDHEILSYETLGYAAAIATLGAYSMKTMIPLRVCGITANILFIAFSYFGGIYPTLVLHAALLPLNSLRLYQMLQLVKHVREAARGDLDLNWLKPFMSSRPAKSGETIFCKGDSADEMFYIVSGRFRLRESGIAIEPGTLVGEFGLFSPGGTRTQTLECSESGSMLHISYDGVRQLYFQNPQFGFYLMQLISRRLFENHSELETRFATALPVQTSS